MHLGPKPKVGVDAFEDLLGGHSFAAKKNEPKTIKEMRKDDRAKITDPEVLKVSKHYKISGPSFSLSLSIHISDLNWQNLNSQETVNISRTLTVKYQYKGAGP